jgi:hypothetical protein
VLECWSAGVLQYGICLAPCIRPEGPRKHSPGFTLGNRFIASCPEWAPECRSVMSHDFLGPFQGGVARKLNPG